MTSLLPKRKAKTYWDISRHCWLQWGLPLSKKTPRKLQNIFLQSCFSIIFSRSCHIDVLSSINQTFSVTNTGCDVMRDTCTEKGSHEGSCLLLLGNCTSRSAEQTTLNVCSADLRELVQVKRVLCKLFVKLMLFIALTTVRKAKIKSKLLIAWSLQRHSLINAPSWSCKPRLSFRLWILKVSMTSEEGTRLRTRRTALSVTFGTKTHFIVVVASVHHCSGL